MNLALWLQEINKTYLLTYTKVVGQSSSGFSWSQTTVPIGLTKVTVALDSKRRQI